MFGGKLLPYMGDAHVGEGAPQSMHFWFWRVDFWRTRSWDFASSTEMSAAIVYFFVNVAVVVEG
jgi:hypothetical protein